MNVELVLTTEADAQPIRNLYPLYLHDVASYEHKPPNRHGVLEDEIDARTWDELLDRRFRGDPARGAPAAEDTAPPRSQTSAKIPWLRPAHPRGGEIPALPRPPLPLDPRPSPATP
jgi:hypothetical protein